jgi:hypothetical protein
MIACETATSHNPARRWTMRDDAETTLVLYFVESDEHVVLQELECDVLSVLSTNKVEGHATWVNKLDAANDRFVQLWVATESQSTFLLEWPSRELAAHSLDELRACLADKRRQRKPTRRAHGGVGRG